MRSAVVFRTSSDFQTVFRSRQNFEFGDLRLLGKQGVQAERSSIEIGIRSRLRFLRAYAGYCKD